MGTAITHLAVAVQGHTSRTRLGPGLLTPALTYTGSSKGRSSEVTTAAFKLGPLGSLTQPCSLLKIQKNWRSTVSEAQTTLHPELTCKHLGLTFQTFCTDYTLWVT